MSRHTTLSHRLLTYPLIPFNPGSVFGQRQHYDALKLSDREILDTLSVARSEGAMVMLHAENADCIAWLTERLLAAGHTAPRYHATTRPRGRCW